MLRSGWLASDWRDPYKRHRAWRLADRPAANRRRRGQLVLNRRPIIPTARDRHSTDRTFPFEHWRIRLLPRLNFPDLPSANPLLRDLHRSSLTLQAVPLSGSFHLDRRLSGWLQQGWHIQGLRSENCCHPDWHCVNRCGLALPPGIALLVPCDTLRVPGAHALARRKE